MTNIDKNSTRHPMCLRIIEAREKSGLSGKEMAERLNIEYHTYNKYETRSPMTRPELLSAFCDITKVEIRWIITGKGLRDRSEQSEDMADLWEGFMEATPEVQLAVKALLAQGKKGE